MKRVSALSDQQRAFVAGKLACRASPVKLHATDATHFILGHVPSPRRYGVPFSDVDLHSVITGQLTAAVTRLWVEGLILKILLPPEVVDGQRLDRCQ